MGAHEEANKIALANALEKLTQTIQGQGDQSEVLNDIKEQLATIANNTRPKNKFLRATKTTWGIIKAPFQLVSGPVKAATIAVGLPSLIAAGTYVGNGGDAMDIPCNLKDWSNKHFGENAALTLTLSDFCEAAHNFSHSDDHSHDGLGELDGFDGFEDEHTVPYDNPEASDIDFSNG